MAQRFAAMGARLALWDVNREGAAETASYCQTAGAEARAYHVDLAEAAHIADASRSVRKDLGVPFALINNASIYPRSPVLELALSEWERVLRVNLTGAFLCARNISPMMVESGRGAIVNISSTVALRGDPNGAHYAATKAGLIALTKSLALALAPKGVRVNCVLPGIADTAQPLGAMTREQLIDRGRDIPLGRIGMPDDIAGIVAFLIGADAAYLTGQSIAVNGGALMLP
jgi:NAD(P)-dependent dehydrogenase (short-subunit alcohol dehydrogenase family)